MKQHKLLVFAVASSLVAPSLLSATAVSASEINTPSSVQTDSSQNTEQSVQQVKELDKYVTVENNQFVLTVPNGVSINVSTLDKAKQNIQQINSVVQKNGYQIDANTKSVVIPSSVSSISTMSDELPAESKDYHWWGVTIYFRSNDAINGYIATLRTSANRENSIAAGDDAATIAATAAGLGESVGVATALAGAASSVYGSRLSSMADTVDSFNQVHSNEKVQVDVYLGLYCQPSTFTD